MDDRQIWVMLFMTIYGWQFHPGASRGVPLTADECARLADLALTHVKERFK